MRVSFPRMGSLTLALSTLLEELGIDVIKPPPLSQQSLKLGCRYAPEGACLPFKLVLGNFLEALEQGADTLIMLGGSGPCRFGYFGHLQHTIIQDLGLAGQVLVIEPSSLFKQLGQLTEVNLGRFNRAVFLAWRKLAAADKLEQIANQARAIEEKPGHTSALYEKYLEHLATADSIKSIKTIELNFQEECPSVKGGSSHRPAIGLVGDIYMLNEPFANGNLEKIIGEQGFYVHRSIYLSNWIKQHLFPGYPWWYRYWLLHQAKPFLLHEVGGHGLDTVACTIDYLRKGYAGVIQILPMTCMPEIVAQSVLPNVHAAFGNPILSLILDEHGADLGVQTRVEAFLEIVADQHAKSLLKAKNSC